MSKIQIFFAAAATALIAILTAPNAADADGTHEWRDFRHVFPYPHQEIAVYGDNDRFVHIVFSEPPARILVAAGDVAAEAFGEAVHSVEVLRHQIGYDGWAADLLISVAPETDQALFDGLVALTERAFGTDHKASYLQMEAQPWRSELEYTAPAVLPNLSISHASLHSWLFEEGLEFGPEGAPPQPLTDLLAARATGVLYSDQPGLVLLSLDPDVPLDEVRGTLRVFTLDSDLVLGAVLLPNAGAQRERLVLVGRTRDTALRDAPPLRMDAILSLAAADAVDLAQSYERNMPFAGKVIDEDLEATLPPLSLKMRLYEAIYGPLGVDWAPILLSRELTHTEFGHLLNVTDQILKAWSLSGGIDYGNFIYREPLVYPTQQGVMTWLAEELGRDVNELTFNWNTAGYGSWLEIDGVQVFVVNRTGSLPVSYLPDLGTDEGRERVNSALRAAEDVYWEFFAGLSNPHLIRVAQYTALHQIFSRADIAADRSTPIPSESVYADRWAALARELDASLGRLLDQNGQPTVGDNGCFFDAGQIAAVLAGQRDEIRDITGADRSSVVSVLTDRRRLLDENLEGLNSIESAYSRAVDEVNSRITAYNETIERCRIRVGVGCTDAQLATREREIERLESAALLLERRYQRASEDLRQTLEAVDTIAAVDGFTELVTAFGSCDTVIDGVVDGNPEMVGAVYKTPSIVVSRAVDEITSVGGHNIDGRTAQVIPDRGIRRGELHIDAENGSIRLSPEDASKAPEVARTVERQWRTYQFGTLAERARIERELREILARPARVAEPFSAGALALRDVDAASNQNLSLGRRDTRVFVKASEQRIDEATANALESFASVNEAQIVTQRIDGQFGIFVAGRRPPVMVVTDNTQVFQAHVQRLANEVANSTRPPKDVLVVSRGGVTRADAENLRITAETRQIVAEAAGGGDGIIPPNGRVPSGSYFGRGGGNDGAGGRFPGGKRLQVIGDVSSGSKQLRRTDLDWRAASIEVREPSMLIGAEGMTLAIRIPANRTGGEPVLARLVAAFRGRSATDSDVARAKATAKRVFEDAGQQVLDQAANDPTLGLVLQRIRDDFQRDVGTMPPVVFDERADFIVVRVWPEDDEASRAG